MNENRQKNAAISILAGLIAPVIVIIFLLTTLVTIDAFSQPEGIRLAQSVQSQQITKEQSEIAKTIGEAGKEEAQTESIARASYLDSLERFIGPSNSTNLVRDLAGGPIRFWATPLSKETVMIQFSIYATSLMLLLIGIIVMAKVEKSHYTDMDWPHAVLALGCFAISMWGFISCLN